MTNLPLSIIIPTYNEETEIAYMLEQLLRLTEQEPDIEIIVSDASNDATLSIVQQFPIRWCISKKGRSLQMNVGAQQSRGEILYFLHADTLPPQDFIAAIRQAVAAGKNAGCFQMRFDDNHPLMQFFGWCTRIPLLLCRGGDQSLFITRSLFQELGGFKEEMHLMEDYDIIQRIEAHTSFHILEQSVTTSARKYHCNGILPLQFHFAMLHLMYANGATQEELVGYYQANIR